MLENESRRKSKARRKTEVASNKKVKDVGGVDALKEGDEEDCHD